MKFSVLMQVWNEELCLPCALAGLLPVVDEIVISNGGPHGPSTDGTKAIIVSAIDSYPDKIVYLEGTYLREDGAWDEARQVNEGIAHITGDYMMRTAADIIFDEADVVMIRDIIERFPDKRFFYSPLIDFGGDTDHIILQGHMAVEEALPREIVQADGCIWSMASNPHAAEVGERKLYGMVADIDWEQDILYMPHVRRFHYGYVKPFEWLVTKYIRLINAKHHDGWAELQEAGEQAMYAEAINWARNLKDTLPLQPYTGEYPVNGEPLRSMDTMDGHDKFMQSYLIDYVGEHARPNVPGWIDRLPTDAEVSEFNEGRMPAEQPPLTLGEIGFNSVEAFLAQTIQHFYPGANVLDVGCGNGKLIAGLLHGGYIASGSGVDASVTMAQNAQQTAENIDVQANFVVGTLESVDITTQFDVVIAKDLLEHLYNVNQGLATLATMLKDSGMLCGSVPLWNVCDCDAHLHHFSSDSLKHVLSRFFDIVSVSVIDLTGDGERHIRYTALYPLRGEATI